MPGTVVPKENPARRNKHESFILERRTDDDLVGPELSWTLDWHPETKKWWDEIRTSEIALILEPSDWRFLQDTALMHHHVWNSKKMSIAQMTAAMAEIRQRVAKFGATLEDRLKLRIRFADAETKELKNEREHYKTQQDYRAMLESDNDS